MNLNDYLLEVAQRVGVELSKQLLNGETAEQHLMRSFNMFHKDFNSRHPWVWRMKDGVFQMTANYTTGTVRVTNGSRTVDQGTGFTSAMIGRIFKADRDGQIYEILDVPNTTTLTLNIPYIGDTGSGLSFLIWRKYYDLPPDVPYSSELYLSEWPHITQEIPGGTFRSVFVDPYLTGYPFKWTWERINRKVTTYTTGTISTTENTRTFTGSGTSWLDNLFPGTKVVVGANIYNVETVDSDTQFTSVQNASATESTNYRAETSNRSQISFSSVPNPVVNIFFRYQKRTYDYVNKNDEVEIWDGMEHIITSVMHGYYLEKLTSEDAFSWLRIYESQIERAWQSLQDKKTIDTIPVVQEQEISGYRRSIYG